MDFACFQRFDGWFFVFRPGEVDEKEYKEFYKSITKDFDEPLAYTHFTAEGEVTFKSVLYVPKRLPQDAFQNYGKKVDNIKVIFVLFSAHFRDF